MPDRDVKSLRDLINFQYAKIIACSAFNCANGMEAKKKCYGFIKKTYRDLSSGKKAWSDIEREDWQLVESDKECAYCGETASLAREHIVPGSLRINERCPSCDEVQSIHNKVWACRKCNSEKGTMGLYSFYKKRLPSEKKYFDFIPPLVEKKYLKTVYECLSKCTPCLNSGDMDGDGELTVLDIDFAMKQFGDYSSRSECPVRLFQNPHVVWISDPVSRFATHDYPATPVLCRLGSTIAAAAI